MKPLIDVTPLQDGNRFRGIGTYVRGLLSGLDEIAVHYRRMGLPTAEVDVEIDVAMQLRRRPLKRTPLRHVTPQDGEVVHLTGLAAADTRVNGPFIATVHDPIPLLFPQWHFRGRGGRRRRGRFRRYVEQLQQAHHLIAVSQSTASQFARILDRPLADFTVTPLAPAALPAPSGWQWRDGAPYLFVAANHEPHKNLTFAVDVVATLPLSERVPLVTSGVNDQRSWRRIEDRAAELHVELAHEGYVDEQRLADLYSGARAVLMPSLFEGFGLPSLEAMSCGTEVVVSDRGALPEVVGSVGTVLPLERERWAHHVADLLRSSEVDQERFRSYAASFTWRRTAGATMTAYAQLDARSG